jgi:hypothetical protein
MTNANNYDLSLNLLDGACQSLANASKNLKLLREGTAFNQVLNNATHIIEPDELTHILDKFAEQHPDWEICLETDHGTVSEKLKMNHNFYEGMGNMIVLDFE